MISTCSYAASVHEILFLKENTLKLLGGWKIDCLRSKWSQKGAVRMICLMCVLAADLIRKLTSNERIPHSVLLA